MSNSKRRHPSLVLLIIAVFSLIFASLLLAESAAPTKKIRTKYEHLKSELDGKVRLTTLMKAIIYHEDAMFEADKILMRSTGEKHDVHEFTCTGNPVFTDPENKITGDKVIGKSTPRIAEFVGNVVMVSTPKKKDKANGGDMKGQYSGEPSTTTCDNLSYNYTTKIGKANGSVVVKQKHRTVWADEGIYEQKVELITLRGNVRMQNTGEDELKELKDAETVTISLENDWIDIVAKPGGKVEMIFDVKDEESSGEPTAKENGGNK
ncbi:MAG: hypothetical protein ACYC7E_13410 [Armatimonadota bacterium]